MRIKNLLKHFLPYSARNIDLKFLKLMDKISQIENSGDDSGWYHRIEDPYFLTQLKNSLDKHLLFLVIQTESIWGIM